MERPSVRVVVGLLLLAVGVLLLLQNLDLLAVTWDLLWSVVFLLGGIAFLAVFFTDRENWWAAITGFSLLALGVLVALPFLAPAVSRSWGGVIFLGGIGLSFWAVYLARRDHWWAMIPGGVLLTLALVAGLSDVGGQADAGSAFFLGLALTFGLVYLLPTPRGRMNWALIPAAACLALGVLASTVTRSAFSFLWPVLLIILGLYLVYRSLRAPRQP